MKKRPSLLNFNDLVNGRCKDVAAGIYIRRSDDKQSAYGPEAQERHTKDACAKWGLAVVEVYFDDGISGGSANRPAFKKIREDAQAGRLRVIVMHKIDRFARDVIIWLQTIDELFACGVQIISVSDQVDFTNANGRKFLTDAASTAEWYRRNLATEVSKGLSQKALQGGALGLAPFGYRRQFQMNPRSGDKLKGSDDLVPTNDLPIVQRIFTAYASKKHSDTTLAAELNREGIPHIHPQTGDVKMWARDTIRGIIVNPLYAGWVVYRGERFEGKHQAAVSRELWEQCQAIRASRARTKSSAVPLHPDGALLSGIAACAKCKAAMHSYDQGGRYHCKTRRQKGPDACNASQVLAETAQEGIERLLKLLVLPDDVIHRVIAETRQVIAAPSPAPRIDRGAEIRVLKARLINDEITGRVYDAALAALSDDRPALPVVALRLNEAEAERLLRDLPALFAQGGIVQRRVLLQTLFARVFLDKKIGVVAITPTSDYAPLIQAIQAYRTELNQRPRLGSNQQPSAPEADALSN